MGATTKEYSEEEKMGFCHSHSILCSCVLTGNSMDSVEEVVVQKTLKCETNREKNGLYV